MTAGETTGLEVGDEYDGDDLFAGTSRADETSGDGGESMMDDDRDSNTSSALDMSDSQPSTSSSSPLSTTPRGVRRGRAACTSRGGRGTIRGRGRGRAHCRGRGRASRARRSGTAGRSGDRRGAGMPHDEYTEDEWEKKEADSLVYPFRCAGGPTAPAGPYRMTFRLISFVVFLQTVSGSLLLTKQIVMLPKIQPYLTRPAMVRYHRPRSESFCWVTDIDGY